MTTPPPSSPSVAPGDCVLFGPGRSGVVLGVSSENVVVVRTLLDDEWTTVHLSGEQVETKKVAACKGLQVLDENGLGGVCVDVSESSVTLSDGRVVAAGEVRCPSAKAAPIVSCVSNVAFSAVEAARKAVAATPMRELLDGGKGALERRAKETRDALRDAAADENKLDEYSSTATAEWEESLRLAKERAAPVLETGRTEAAALGEIVEGSRAGKLAMEEVNAASHFELDDEGALATLSKAASAVSQKNEKLADTAKKLARRLATSQLLDDAYIEAAFSACFLAGSGTSLSEDGNGDRQKLIRKLADSTRAFANEVLMSEEKIDRVSVEAALEAGVVAAIDTAPEEMVAEACASADCFDGALFKQLNAADQGEDSTAAMARLAAKYSEKFLGESEPQVLKRALDSLTEGSGVRETLARALDDDDAVAGVGQAVSGSGAKLAAALTVLDKDDRAKHFASKLLSDDTGLVAAVDSLASLDVDQASERLEDLLKSDAAERAKLVEKATDSALDFFLTHLPAMPVPPLDLEREGVLYELGNLNLSQFKLVKNDVEVDLPFGGDLEKSREVFFVDDQFSNNASGAAVVENSAFAFGLKARSASAKFERITWRFKQQYFPYLEGSGTADVVVEDGALWLEVGVRRRENKPVVTLSRCDVAIATLEVRVENMQFGWLLNALGSVFREHVRLYVQDSLKQYLKRRAREWLSPLDAPLSAAWPAVAQVFSLPDPKMLPLANLEDLDENVVLLLLVEKGPLGLELSVEDEGNTFRLTGFVDGSQAARKTSRAKARSLMNAVLIAIDDVELEDREQTIQLVTSHDRPKRLYFRIDKAQQQETLRHPAAEKKKSALRYRAIEMCPASAPNRPVASLGFKLRPNSTLAAVEIARAQTMQQNELVGSLIVACSGAPRLVSLSVAAPVDANAVGARISGLNSACAKSGKPFSIVVAKPPDFTVDFESPPSDIAFQAHAGYAVIAALEPSKSPLELAGAQIGDVVVAVNDVVLPTRNGYAADVKSILKAAVVRAARDHSTFWVTLSRGGDDHDDRVSAQRIIVEVGPMQTPRLGSTFTRCNLTGAPRLKRFDGIPGTVASSPHWKSKLLHPGLALIAVGSDRVNEDDNLDQLRERLSTAKSCTFRDVEAYDALVDQFAEEVDDDQRHQDDKGIARRDATDSLITTASPRDDDVRDAADDHQNNTNIS